MEWDALVAMVSTKPDFKRLFDNAKKVHSGEVPPDFTRQSVEKVSSVLGSPFLCT